MNRQEHWNQIYQSKAPQELSWYEERPELSLEMIAASGVRKDAGIIDVGAGESTLVDCLLDAGYTRLAVRVRYATQAETSLDNALRSSQPVRPRTRPRRP